MPVTPKLKRQKQEANEFDSSLAYMTKFYQMATIIKFYVYFACSPLVLLGSVLEGLHSLNKFLCLEVMST